MEVLTRKLPYPGVAVTSFVDSWPQHHSDLRATTIPALSVDQDIKTLLLDCTAPTPDERPDFSAICLRLASTKK